MKCSRCRIIREVGVTDNKESDLNLYKTCRSCREKLKEYRRVHQHKLRRINEDRKFINDDNNEVDIAAKQVKRSNNITTRKNIVFSNILSKIYQLAHKDDIFIDEICKIDDFTLPRITITENCSLNEEGVPVNLLMKQAEKDEKLKSELAKCLEIHYVSRILHVLSCSNIEFRFYSSSWKNGNYYVQYRCIDDKTAMKRFGIGSDVEIEQDDKIGERQTSLKSKVLDWIEPKNVESVSLQLDVNNEPVNLHFQQSLGYFCESKLNIIVNYSKRELRVKLKHKFHRPELKFRANEPDKSVQSVPMKPKLETISKVENENVKEIGLSDKLENLHKGLTR